MAHDASSNIRVFIRWHEQTVFAGEEVKCTITFKNVASTASQSKQQQPSERSRLASPLRPKSNHGLTPPLSGASGRGHRRSALSLSVPSSRAHSRSGSVQWPAASPGQTDRPLVSTPGHSHKRSLSIVSIGSTSTIDDHPHRNEPPARPQRPNRGHGRASSLQIIPRAQNQTPTAPHSGTSRHSSHRLTLTLASDLLPQTIQLSSVPFVIPTPGPLRPHVAPSYRAEYPTHGQPARVAESFAEPDARISIPRRSFTHD